MNLNTAMYISISFILTLPSVRCIIWHHYVCADGPCEGVEGQGCNYGFRSPGVCMYSLKSSIGGRERKVAGHLNG